MDVAVIRLWGATVMQRSWVGHGCLFAVVVLSIAASTDADEYARASSRVFDVKYAVNQEALPLDSVVLWYTADRGESWHQYGADEDRRSPCVFNAPSEGLFGLFFVVTNATGASSQPPHADTRPHQWVYVDYTPPILQLHEPRVTTVIGETVVQIRWAAIDAHLTSRPVELAYRPFGVETWYPVTAAALANTGRYDWRTPVDLAGSVAIRATVTDEGGHRVTSEPQVLDLATRSEEPASAQAPEGSALKPSTDTAVQTALGTTTEDRARALLREALAEQERGRYRRGISVLRKAVTLDPGLTDGFVAMADMLLRIGDLEPALNAYEIALRQQPHLRSALRGAAMVDRKQKNYIRAAERLRTILRYNPDDAEVWMNLGDVAVFQGNDVLARDCYKRAATIDPRNETVIEQAQRRLNLMNEVRGPHAPDSGP
jgi:Flp pilus assembly protein TadD